LSAGLGVAAKDTCREAAAIVETEVVPTCIVKFSEVVCGVTVIVTAGVAELGATTFHDVMALVPLAISPKICVAISPALSVYPEGKDIVATTLSAMSPLAVIVAEMVKV
jgi:hypothetical protein